MSRRPTTSTSSAYRLGRAALATVTGVACAAALAIAPASAADDGSSRARGLPVLKGVVGPGFTITISDDSVPAGRYKLVVNDKGTIHNFHIFGAGVDKATSIPGTGKTVFKIRLRAGEYTIVCDAHEASMKTTLTVT
jgi:plastocyanin